MCPLYLGSEGTSTHILRPILWPMTTTAPTCTLPCCVLCTNIQHSTCELFFLYAPSLTDKLLTHLCRNVKSQGHLASFLDLQMLIHAHCPSLASRGCYMSKPTATCSSPQALALTYSMALLPLHAPALIFTLQLSAL